MQRKDDKNKRITVKGGNEPPFFLYGIENCFAAYSVTLSPCDFGIDTTINSASSSDVFII